MGIKGFIKSIATGGLMSLPKREVRAKGVLPEAHERLALLAMSRNETIDKAASDILNTALLGTGYTERLAAERMARLGLLGNNWETQKSPSAVTDELDVQ